MPIPEQNRLRVRFDLNPETYTRLEAHSYERGWSINRYCKMLLEETRDDYESFHLHMASKHAYMTFLMVFLYLPMLHGDAEIEEAAKQSIAKSAHAIFGDAPPRPTAISSPNTTTETNFVTEILAILNKYAADRFAANK